MSVPPSTFPLISRQASILIVDDNPINLRLLSRLLVQEGFVVRKALDGEMALKSIQTLLPDLILLDIMMPQFDGYSVCQRLKADPATAAVPIIVLSALSASFDKVKAFRSGASDYVTKPFQFEEVLARIQNQLALRSAQQALQELNAKLELRVQERTQELAQAHEKLMEMALKDQLTGLPNRVSFSERLKTAIARAQLNRSERFAVLYLDCDRFKTINDSLGHSKGDELLIEVAERLQRIQRQTRRVEGVARFGGDEFALLMTDVLEPTMVLAVAKDILQLLSKPFLLGQQEVCLNASIGIVWGTTDYNNAEYLLRDADTAMYWAKAAGKGQYRWFEPAMYDRAVDLLQLEADLRTAVDRQEFRVDYQPIVALAAASQPKPASDDSSQSAPDRKWQIVGAEALVRWHHPQRGVVNPDVFIPFSEETGLITAIGYQVLLQACQDLAQWQQRGAVSPAFTISVNLSARQLLLPNILDLVQQVIRRTGLQPHNLRLELTESLLMTNQALAESRLRQLRDYGVQLSIDDFGTGYSSLSYLNQLPADYIKVDQSFVKPVTDADESLGIIPLIVNIAHTTGMRVVAEGIETEAQYRQLAGLGCDHGQGFFFFEPLPAEEMLQLLSQTVLPSIVTPA
ncbi:MAG: EAL domain-containing protein [Cyanobacteria bacterium P01_A01_bin.105]